MIEDELDNEILDIDQFFTFRRETNEIRYVIGKTLHIDYMDVKKAVTKRPIRADYLIEADDGEMYVEAFCYLRNSVRRFKAEGIIQIIDDHGMVIEQPIQFLINFKIAA